MSGAVLIVEDNATLAKNMASYLREHGYGVRTAGQGTEALAQIEHSPPDVVLVDYSLPGMDGLELIRRVRAGHPSMKAIMITGHGSVEIAVEAMKTGACDYLSKPIGLADVKLTVERALRPPPRPAEAVAQDRRKSARSTDRLLGESPPMLALKDTVRRLLEAEHALKDRDRPAVLITGETGTGKELVARAIHDGGPRPDAPFIELNCASIPTALVESELFGFERGAFTDARERKQGLVELAQEGTLFLDEIGELDLAVQSKLLKLIEDRVTRRLGGLREQPAQVRIVTATNQHLEQLVTAGRFRADLFFRLRIVHLHVPPLRQRGPDILLLARHFLALHGARYGRPNLQLSRECEAALLDYPWPGNVRELRNALERAVLMATGERIEMHQLELLTGTRPPGPPQAGEGASVVLPEGGVVLERFELMLVRQALARTNWNVTRAAKLLGLSRDTLRYRIEKFELRPDSED